MNDSTGAALISLQEWLERLHIASDEPDVVRRARLFIGVCACFALSALLGLPLLPLMPSFFIQVCVMMLVLSAVAGYVLAIWLSMKGRVDTAALLVGINLSLGVVSFNVGVGQGTHDIIWLLCFNTLVVGTGLRASKIWIYWLINVTLYLLTFAYAPHHYLGAPSNPARGPFLLIVLAAVSLSIYVMVASHEKSVARSEKAAQLAIEAQHMAQASSHAKSMFLANMSHELRTPLNAITGYAELISEELEDAQINRDSMRQDLGYIEQSSVHLLSLIDDVLDLSKIESGKMELCLTRFDLSTLIEEIHTLMLPVAHRTRNTITVHVPGPVHIESDEMRVRQVLLNIISNAIKFTDAGVVSVSLEVDVQNSTCRVTVEDTGIGMSEEHLQRVFDAFIQADSSTTRQYGGTGLGLTLCRNFVLLLGGDISVKSQPGEGSCFVITLPISRHSLA